MQRTLIALIAFCVLLPHGAAADVVLETPRATLVLGGNAVWQSLQDKAAARELIPEGVSMPMAVVRHGGKGFSANAATRDGQTLTVAFAGTDTVLRYELETEADWVVFRLTAVQGTRPESVVLLQLPVAVTTNVGRRLNAAWDAQTAVGVMAANHQADCRPQVGKFATLSAATQDVPGPALEGAAAAVIVCPTGEFKTIARAASGAFGLLTNEDDRGTPVKDTELVRGSYWFMSFGEDEADKVIEYCLRTGIRQVMLSSGAWCTSPGHYLFHEGRYPRGRDSLKAMVARLNEHGILVGMHCFASKISKRDPYVTPVPDPRLLRGVSASWRATDGLLEAPLAQAVGSEQTEIRVDGDLRFWPGSSQVADRYWEGGLDKHLEVLIGSELVRYDSIGPEGTWDTFLGCRRGAWGTKAGSHSAGTVAYHLGVDGCINGFLIDQETDLMDEVAERLAGIFNDCGFDMIYFDGGEDVDRRRFNYYASNFQAQVVQRINRRPILHMGTIMTHSLWHSFARSSTVDQYLSTLGGAIIGGRAPTAWPTVKEHIDRSVDYMLSVRQDMMPGELGWFGIWPAGKRTYTVRIKPDQYEQYRQLGCEEGPVDLPSRENTLMTGQLVSPDELRITVAYDGLQFDEVEYLMAKSLGYDVPVSLQTSFSQMDAHPLTPAILDIVREYESLRLARAVAPEVREMLQQRGTDFAMIRQQGDPTFVPVERLASVGEDRELRVFVGALNNGSVATVWHTTTDGHLLLGLDPGRIVVTDFSGQVLPVKTDQQRTAVPVGSARHTLICRDISPADLRAVLAEAVLQIRQPERLFVRADQFVRLQGEMAKGSDVGVKDPGAFGDVLVATGRPTIKPPHDSYAEYTVDIPRAGLWTIWGRVRYPHGGDQSFGFVLPDEEVTLSHGDGQILGNCGVDADRWHWTGRGSGLTSVPPGQPLTRKLPAGPLTFRIYPREGPGTAARNPRLDLICLTEEPIVPTDEEARDWTARESSP